MLLLSPAILLLLPGPPAAGVLPRGHLPYSEAPEESLVDLEGVRVRRNLVEPLSRLLAAARKDGINLKASVAFRSVPLQRSIYESGARKKGISLRSYAWWTAPPGFSEHHTGLAVDFVDASRPKASFTPDLFKRTTAFTWLKAHAPSFGFEQSFPEGNRLRVAFEPWHWRFVGDGESRTIFAMAREGRYAQDGTTLSPTHTPATRRENH